MKLVTVMLVILWWLRTVDSLCRGHRAAAGAFRASTSLHRAGRCSDAHEHWQRVIVAAAGASGNNDDDRSDRLEYCALSTDITHGAARGQRDRDGEAMMTPLPPPPPEHVGWMERARQLYHFQQQHGHTTVPKRYKANPALGNWVNKQRQQYRNYKAGKKPCSLNENRIAFLDQINFCWDARAVLTTAEPIGRQQWWSRFDELRSCCLLQQRDHDAPAVEIESKSPLVSVSRQTTLGAWLDRQRKAYVETKRCNQADANIHRQQLEQLSEEQISALSDIDPDWWMTRRQWQWENRYRALLVYAQTHGDCSVPISYPDRRLANWVSNQRKQYNLRVAGRPSSLTEDRLQCLQAIGFVWNHWEYEFDQKNVDWKT